MSNEKSEYLFLLGGRLAEERLKTGHTQRSLAELFDKSSRTQIKYESGETAPDAVFLHGLHILGMDVHYILTGEASPNPITTEEKIVLAAYRKLDDRGKAGVFGLLDGMKLSAPAVKRKQKIIFQGNIAQQVTGDIVAPQTIKAGRKKK
ncbi:helix-turn-helix domain-containing protein [Janthinobacterium sp. DSP2-3-3]|uniref:helix-turn-helix domain-containing protein n=1 Tax=Janthinobacterium sp. DSP2-3-3 TaxID=2804596 RepID=UPI003CF314D0